jgi:hypothetical protein
MPLSKQAPCLLAFLPGIPAAPAATIILSDGTLGANSTSTNLFNDSWITQATGSYSALPEATGGNHDQYRRHTGTYGTIQEGAQRSFLAVNYADLIYDPSTGAGITSIGFDYDLRRFQASGLASGGFSQSLMYGYPFLQQGGVSYVFNGRLSHFSGANWTPLAMNSTTATQWSRHPSTFNRAGPANPDFSSAGGALNFGCGFYVVMSFCAAPSMTLAQAEASPRAWIISKSR